MEDQVFKTLKILLVKKVIFKKNLMYISEMVKIVKEKAVKGKF